LADLNDPFFRETVEALELLLSEFPEFHLHPSKRWEYRWALENAH